MTKNYLISAFCLIILIFGAASAFAETRRDVLGLYVGMSKEKADAKLQKIGEKERDERKQQEIWKLKNDSRFSYIIISYDKEFKSVRFVTAKVRPDGKRIRYADVLDTKKAVQLGAENNYNYVLEMPASGDKPAYKIIARGTHKDFLTYFAIEELDTVKK